jgi:N6-adenosine-specific RNA methylase IME4
VLESGCQVVRRDTVPGLEEHGTEGVWDVPGSEPVPMPAAEEVESRFAEFVARDLLGLAPQHFGTILADPPWRFQNRSGKMAPEHRRLHRYPTMSLEEIMELPVARIARPQAHLYLWVPNALLQEGLEVMKRWGFTYKTNLVWYKVREDGGPDGRGVGFYFRNVTELCLFGVRGSLRTGAPGRRQVNLVSTRKGAHSWKPEQFYEIIEKCSFGPFIELFARQSRRDWTTWGNEAPDPEMFELTPPPVSRR